MSEQVGRFTPEQGGTEHEADPQVSKFLKETEEQKIELAEDRDKEVLIEKLTKDLDSLIANSTEIDVTRGAKVQVGTIFEGAQLEKRYGRVELEITSGGKLNTYLITAVGPYDNVRQNIAYALTHLIDSLVSNQQLLPENFKQLGVIDFSKAHPRYMGTPHGGNEADEKGFEDQLFFSKKSNKWKAGRIDAVYSESDLD